MKTLLAILMLAAAVGCETIPPADDGAGANWWPVEWQIEAGEVHK